MILIELCGMPGCGKSTALRRMKEEYPDTAKGLKEWHDLYPRSRVLRFLIKRLYLLRLRMGSVSEADRAFIRPVADALERKGRKASRMMRYMARALALYHRILLHRHEQKVCLLDEGPVQQLSSALYAGEVSDAVPPVDIFAGTGVEYVCIYFGCDIGECVRRNRQRDSSNRYNVEGDERLGELLRTKDHNIRFLMKYTGAKIYTIDTAAAPEECARMLRDILGEIILSGKREKYKRKR